MKGLLAFDIDGTLTHRLDWIDSRVVNQLRQLSEQGWQIALLTGRIFSFSWKILKYLDFPYLLAVQNGADIVSMPSKKSLKRNYLTPSVLPEIDAAYEGMAEDYIIYAGIDKGDFCYYRERRFSKKMLQYLEILKSLGAEPWQSSDFAFEENATFSLIKCFGEEKAMRKLHDKLEKNPQIEVSLVHDPIDPSLYLNLVTHPKANKGDAIYFLKAFSKASVVIAAGDDRNDCKMLKAADVSIAIETAPKEVLKLANVLAKPASELGILLAIEEAISLAGG